MAIETADIEECKRSLVARLLVAQSCYSADHLLLSCITGEVSL
jgi:hypothetical protein